jgi:hypothetical protein
MHRDPCNYKEYFHPGQRAMVEMSLQGDRKFNDGAVVTSVSDTQIALRLSRDRLPDGAMLHPEAPIVVRVGASGSGYRCRGVVLGKQVGEELHMAFVDRVMSEDLREYFRLATEIPVILFNVTGGTAEESGSGGLRVAAAGGLPRIVNISGGGLRTETEMAMACGDIVYATFNLPLPDPKIVPVVAQVVHSEVIECPGGPIFSAGLSFMHVNERDRDTIVRFVCNEEIKRIRLCRKDFFSLQE